MGKVARDLKISNAASANANVNASPKQRGRCGKHHRAKMENCKAEMDPKIPIPVAKLVDPLAAAKNSDLDPNFIHGRHTCDGCLSTPIHGLRYHALNLPDYDLCATCHGNYKGTDIQFKPMQLDRDRHLQARWQRRRMRRHPVKKADVVPVRNCNAVSGTQTKKVIDAMDDDLKEAIRRSLIDALPSKGEDTKEEEDVEVKSLNEAPKTNFPIGSIEVTAGNRHTQKALDAMDPKMKDALSRSLNECFARRAGKGDSSTPPVPDTKLDIVSPTDETQKKMDTMDDAMKEAIRRSLTDFFANRQKKNDKGEKVDTNTSETKEDKTGESIKTMDHEAKEAVRRDLHDFFVRRMKSNEMLSTQQNDASQTSEVKDDIPSVVVDIVVDNNDDDLSDGTEDIASSVDDNTPSIADTEDIQSKLSEDGVTKEDWQMVAEDDEMIAIAAQMLGSALFQSDASLIRDSEHSA